MDDQFVLSFHTDDEIKKIFLFSASPVKWNKEVFHSICNLCVIGAKIISSITCIYFCMSMCSINTVVSSNTGVLLSSYLHAFETHLFETTIALF